MRVERVPLDQIVLDPANARKHGERNIETIKGSLARFGQQKPIVLGKNGVVIAGNGTVTAARSLGWTEINAVKTDLEGTEATAFALADNRTAELAEWDTDVLTSTLKALDELDFDLKSIGFDDFDLSTPETTEGLTDPDDVPEVAETRCKPGDLWLLGKHRLLCGDSTNVQHVERLMGGEKADMVFTDPPYGMDLDADYSDMAKSQITEQGTRAKSKKYRPVHGDDAPFDPGFLLTFFAKAREIFLFGADYYAERISERNSGSWIVWDKRVTESMDRRFGSAFELVWSRERHKRDLARLTWSGIYGQVGVDAGRRLHPTQKPIRLAEWFFERWGKPEDRVVDLFLGSGSTLIACEKTGRRCFGMEIDPKYCDVILARWEKFTGKTATLMAEGPEHG